MLHESAVIVHPDKDVSLGCNPKEKGDVPLFEV